MATYDHLQSLAASYLPHASEHGPCARVLRAFADGRELQRREFDELVGSEIGSPSDKDHFLDFILHCARQALSDHDLSDAELALIT